MFIILLHVCGYLIDAINTDIKRPLTSFSSQTYVAAAEEKTDNKLDLYINQLQLHKHDASVEMCIEIQEKFEKDDHEITRKISKKYQEFESPSYPVGRYIGMIERILIAILVVKNAYAGIVIIGAIKTLARFKQFDEKNFAEEYLLGSLLSVLFGFIGGHIISRIL
jgi:hypothetical protein